MNNSFRSDNNYLVPGILQVAVAGTGLMGRWHAHAARKAGGRITALIDINVSNSEKLKKKYSSAKIFQSVAEMLNHQSVDILHLCTPTKDHLKLAETAIKAGINLLIEKPLAESTEETVYLYDLAKKYNVQICPTHQFIFQESVKKAQKLLSSIEPLIHLQATICSSGGTNSGNGKLSEIAFDIMPHALSLFQVFSNGLLISENFRGWAPQTGELRIEGFKGNISMGTFISLNSRPTINSFEIFGERGTIHLNLFHDYAVIESGTTSKLRKILHPFNLSVKNFSAAVINLINRTVHLETAYPGLQTLVNKFYKSVKYKKDSPILTEQSINIAQIRDKLIAQMSAE